MNKLDWIEGVMPYDKVSIGDVEAWEYCLERGIDKLPRKGKEIITVKSAAENRSLGREWNEGIGKDENGFYLFKM